MVGSRAHSSMPPPPTCVCCLKHPKSRVPFAVMFPQDLLENGLAGTHCAMLGLGDIVIPGVFLALMLRFDRSRPGAKRDTYFYVTFFAYILGLGVTMFVMHVFKHAQVSCCLSFLWSCFSPLFLDLKVQNIFEIFPKLRKEEFAKEVKTIEGPRIDDLSTYVLKAFSWFVTCILFLPNEPEWFRSPTPFPSLCSCSVPLNV